MKQERLLRFAVDAGELTITSGSEAYRAEETILRILDTKYENTSASFVVGTGLFASIHTKQGYDFTALRRIKKRSIDLENLSDINSVSRGYVGGEITLKEAENEIEKIRSKTEKRKISIFAGVALAPVFFTPLFGGTLLDAFAALIVGIILSFFMIAFEKRSVGVFMRNLMGGIVIAVVSSILSRLKLLNAVDIVIISGLMPLLPGSALTSAIRDILEEDYLSGTSRLVEAVVVAISIAFGVSIGLSLLPAVDITFVGKSVLFSNPIFNIFSAAMATYAFSIMFKAPKNERILCSLIGAVGWGFYLLTQWMGQAAPFCAFVGTLSVAFLSRVFAHSRKRPQTVFFLPGIIPYVPGAGIFYTMNAIKNTDLTNALSKGLETIAIAGAIAVTVGVIALLPSKWFINLSNLFKRITKRFAR